MLLPLGIINQLNAPTTYLTVDRPLTDLLIIPTFWRELGAGIFGEVGGAVRYQLDVVRGLDGAGFSAQAPLAGGRSNGFGGGTTGAAVTARLELFGASDGFVMGGSGYYGSASGGQPALDGVTVGIVEGDARFRGGGVELRAEFAQFFIFNSYRVNDYLGLLGQDAVPKAGRGGYVQVGYDVLRLGDADTRQELLFFAAYENVNPRSAMSPYNYNPPTITGPGETPPNAPSPSAVVRARRHRLPAAARAGVQGRPADRARRRRAAADGAGDGRRARPGRRARSRHNWRRPRAESRGSVWPSASRSDDHHASICFIRLSAVEPGHRGQGPLHDVLRAHAVRHRVVGAVLRRSRRRRHERHQELLRG